jgi:hypothetical protein
MGVFDGVFVDEVLAEPTPQRIVWLWVVSLDSRHCIVQNAKQVQATIAWKQRYDQSAPLWRRAPITFNGFFWFNRYLQAYCAAQNK